VSGGSRGDYLEPRGLCYAQRTMASGDRADFGSGQKPKWLQPANESALTFNNGHDDDEKRRSMVMERRILQVRSPAKSGPDSERGTCLLCAQPSLGIWCKGY
jgi:hypothetical protein